MRLSIIAFAFFIAAILSPAHAALGGLSSALASELLTLRATALAVLPAAPTSVYQRYDFVLPDGGRASEFADINGQVFAISWQSPTMPELGTLLGSHRSTLDKAQLPQIGLGRASRQINIIDGDCFLVSSGHLRAYRGYSYLASQLPAGFDLQVLSS